MKQEKWWHVCVARVIKWFFWLYWKTIHVDMRGMSHILEETRGTIVLLWHDSLCIVPLFAEYARTHPCFVLISNSRDGDVPTAVCRCFNNVDVIRVKHTARAQALTHMCRILQKGASLLITSDGPRGPWRKIKPGAIFASIKSQSPIVCVVVSASRYISLPTKDRMKLPLPGSSVIIECLSPTICTEEQEVSHWQELLEKSMESKEASLRG